MVVRLLHTESRGSSTLLSSTKNFVGGSPSWLRHRILIPTRIGSNPIPPASIFPVSSKVEHSTDNRETEDRYLDREPNVFTLCEECCIISIQRGVSLMVEREPSKLTAGVRFSYPAPQQGKFMDMDQAAVFLAGTILISLAVTVIAITAVVINYIIGRYWKPVRVFTADSWQMLGTHTRFAEPQELEKMPNLDLKK